MVFHTILVQITKYGRINARYCVLVFILLSVLFFFKLCLDEEDFILTFHFSAWWDISEAS